MGLQRQVQALVPQHGRHDHIVGEPPQLLQVQTADGQDVVAVEHGAALVHKERAVAVAIVGEAHVGQMGLDRQLQRRQVR